MLCRAGREAHGKVRSRESTDPTRLHGTKRLWLDPSQCPAGPSRIAIPSAVFNWSNASSSRLSNMVKIIGNCVLGSIRFKFNIRQYSFCFINITQYYLQC